MPKLTNRMIKLDEHGNIKVRIKCDEKLTERYRKAKMLTAENKQAKTANKSASKPDGKSSDQG